MTPEAGLAPAVWCFSESANRVLVSMDARPMPEVLRRAREAGVPATDLGVVGGDRLVVEGAFDVGLSEAAAVWRSAIPNAVAGDVVPSS